MGSCWCRRVDSKSSSSRPTHCIYSFDERARHIATDGATFDLGDKRPLPQVAPLASPALPQAHHVAPRVLHFASPSAPSVRPSTYTCTPFRILTCRYSFSRSKISTPHSHSTLRHSPYSFTVASTCAFTSTLRPSLAESYIPKQPLICCGTHSA